ncbi:CapA family protein [Chloroflexota bacterium]
MTGDTTSPEASATLIAVGDIMLGENTLCLGRGVGSVIKNRGASYPFLQVASILGQGDIVFGNLEAVLSNNGINKKVLNSLHLRATPEAVEGLKYAGFNILSLANNHALEHGQEALDETANILLENDIKHVGVDTNTTKAREPLVMHVKGIAIAFLSYCLVPDKTAYISIKDPEEIYPDVRKARADADIVVVSLHWGNEYIQWPSPAQIKLAHQVIDSGANVILGHHPHVLQGIERYHNGVIAYSLGNFIFDMWQEKTRRSVILKLRLSKTGVSDMELIPVHINGTYQLEILQNESAACLLSEVEDCSSKIVLEDSPESSNCVQRYAAEAAACRRWYRWELKWYFLRNLHRYPPRFALQVVKAYLSKMLSRAS